MLVKESFQPAELIARIRRLVANDGAPAAAKAAVVTRLLYVEDNDDNVYMLKMRLELLDEFEVLVAEDGEKGCAAALEHQPELILMDLDLPVVDGWEATRRLKSDPRTRDIPVIALSAHALAGAREKAHRGRMRRVRYQAGRIRAAAWGRSGISSGGRALVASRWSSGQAAPSALSLCGTRPDAWRSARANRNAEIR